MSASVLAASALAALAAAMGIGRFAFTPVLPMMLETGDVSLAEGGWLAAANYAGYLAGALAAARLPGRLAVRAGLAGIALGTLAMALEVGFAGWLVLRALAGVASAWVLIHVSAWSLEQLPPRLHGVVFSGVGVGIAVAGFVCLPLSDPNVAWLVLGVLALPIALVPFTAIPSGKTSHDGGNAASLLLVVCYGAFGFGYIIPATFIPAMAREMLGGAALFGWAWPLLGAAAALSTLIAPRIETRRLWSNAHLVMALGVVAPFVVPGLKGILIGAIAVGGTFMLVTMAGLKEGRRAGGPRLMARMTAAFAAGQIAGPALVAVLPSLLSASLAACALLAASGLALRFSHDRAPSTP
jgi:MFS family permease